jgi:uncharacterized protein (TIGR02145 family)
VALVLYSLIGKSQDIIVRKSGDEIQAKVTDIELETVKYKMFSNITGPTYTILKSDVFMIKYENGTKDVFGIKDETPKAENKNQAVVVQNVSGSATGILTDARDGKTYKTIVLGEQTWMAENLAYKAASGCWAYADNDSNVAKYGYLYNWETSKNVCPIGWHLPSETEFRTLAQFFGGVKTLKIKTNSGASELTAGTKMKSTTGWEGIGNGTDEKGFNALPAGFRLGRGAYKNMGNNSCWWSSTEDYGYNADLITAYSLELLSSNGYIGIHCLNLKNFGLSVRCIKDYLR